MKRPDPELQKIKVLPDRSKYVVEIDNGLIEVHFPYEKPYYCQENYIKSMVKALKYRKNALLESPTGTGKTLCLLSAALGFLNTYIMNPSLFDDYDEDGNPVKHANSSLPVTPEHSQQDKEIASPKSRESDKDQEETAKKNYLNQDKRVMIIYCTRTHSQISQVIKEIKSKLAYEVDVIPLASRKHMCINSEIYEENSVDQVCKIAREKNQKYQKKRFQAILNSEKVNFRGHQKALMRIMDGTSKKKEKTKSNYRENQYTFDFDMNNPEDQQRYKRKKIDMKAREEELRKYEEKVFVDYVIESNNMRDKKGFSKDYDREIRRYQNGFCPFYNGGEKRIFETELNINPHFEKMSQKLLTQSVYDIEDLNKIGKLHTACPYYLARSKLSNVDIAVIPYHYILTPSIRKKLPLKLENSIIIFDEAHNLERICEEIMSFKLSVDKLRQCENTLQKLEGVYREKDSMSAATTNQNNEKAGDKLDDAEILRTFVESLRKEIETLPNRPRHSSVMERANSQYFLYDISEIHEILEQALRPVFRIDRQEKKKKKRQKKMKGKMQDQQNEEDHDNDSCEGMSSQSDDDNEQWSGFDKDLYEELKNKQMTEKERRQQAKLMMINKRVDELIEVLDQSIADLQSDSKHLNKLKNSLKTIQHLSKISERERMDFRLYIEQISTISRAQFGKSYEYTKKLLGYICLNPSYIFKQLVKKKPRSIILTSGTLSPMDSFSDELRTDFGIQLENQHAIEKGQLMVSVVQCDFNAHPFNFVYEKRKDYNQILGLGHFIQKLEENIPGGILLFFPSYDLMSVINEAWDTAQIKFQRKMFKEEKKGSDFEATFKKYLKRIHRGKKALLMCVCRGKLSEGIDFLDNAARAIFVIGIPYPCINDPRVVQKQEYLDIKHKEEPNFDINGQKWYKLQASRTVNQAIGRVIRHIRDYGSIFLCDERYGQQTIEISKWMKDRKRVFDKKNILSLENEVKYFFKTNIEKFSLIDINGNQITQKNKKKKDKMTKKRKHIQIQLENDNFKNFENQNKGNI